MFLQEFSVQGYRSLYDITIPLQQINVITGANGSGKTNLYKALHLVAIATQGNFAKNLALEGGMPSVLWGGERKEYTRTKQPVRMTLTIKTTDYSYQLSAGLPPPGMPVVGGKSAFMLDPEIKNEYVWHGKERRKSTTYLRREAYSTWVINKDDKEVAYPISLLQTESVLSQLREPHLYPELSALREAINKWRFYHHFRTDPHSPVRLPQIGILTPVLDNEGVDLAAALQTIIEIGDAIAVEEAIEDAFPGSKLIIHSDKGCFEIKLSQPGINRALDARELSDGTLRYLCLIACLFSPRPPKFLALNEPETSLHPDLMRPLGNLILKAGKYSQICVTTHSTALVKVLMQGTNNPAICLQKVNGYTELKIAD